MIITDRIVAYQIYFSAVYRFHWCHRPYLH